MSNFTQLMRQDAEPIPGHCPSVRGMATRVSRLRNSMASALQTTGAKLCRPRPPSAAKLIRSIGDIRECQVGPTGTLITRPRVRALRAEVLGVLAGDGAGAAGETHTALTTTMAYGSADLAARIPGRHSG